ncbi:MFS transporter [Acrocarpospora macrocephala]|uniref:MFS transporter n=1 Tax=Acrocarpospora macrocephala TaxID=150177 RepID=A0A5M3WEA8_9ACTN|nr:MFS transporter [Acrocarpospora macrocephala]GES07176.1 MFS transporter [Acrocarpospora macrocephala]
MSLRQFRESDPPGELLRHRPWLVWIGSSAMARLPMAMTSLAMVLVGEAGTGSLAVGTQLAGIVNLCSGVFGPPAGRAFDRVELRAAVRLTLAGLAFILLAMLPVVWLGAPLWALYVLSVLLGLAMAGLWGGLRALLLVTVPAAQLRRAHFAESLLVEFAAVVGPALVAVLVMVGRVAAAIIVMAVLSLLAAWGMRRIPALPPASGTRTSLLPPRDVGTVGILVAIVGMGYGLLVAAAPLRMGEYGLDAGATGWFMAALSAGACLGGLAVSVRPVPARRARPVAAALLFGTALLVLPSAVATTGLAYGAALFVAGLGMVPLNGLLATEIESRLGLSRRAEGFSYFGSASVAGGAMGYFAVGALSGWCVPATVSLLSSALFAALAITLTCSHLKSRRPTLAG